MRKKGLLKALCLLLTVMMLAALLPQTTVHAAESVRYLDQFGAQKTAAATQITSETRELTSGWYYVSGNVSISGTLVVSGDVRLILTDGCQLSVTSTDHRAAIQVEGEIYRTQNGADVKTKDTDSLTIYAQSTGENMGALFATAKDNGKSSGDGAGIGGRGSAILPNSANNNTLTSYSAAAGGNITIHGGRITAKSVQGAGIGGGGGGLEVIFSAGFSANITNGGDAGSIVISGGLVKATATKGAGIGSGGGGIPGVSVRHSSSVVISGGTVEANSVSGAGIGGGGGREGYFADNGSITALPGDGGGGGSITISGGTVTASRIGGGNGGTGADCYFYGDLSLTSDYFTKGDGQNGGDGGGGGSITISGGTVSAGEIGGGRGGHGGSLAISGGTVQAGRVGGGQAGNNGQAGHTHVGVTITFAANTALSKLGNDGGDGADITLSGGTVEAEYIGGGDGGGGTGGIQIGISAMAVPKAGPGGDGGIGGSIIISGGSLSAASVGAGGAGGKGGASGGGGAGSSGARINIAGDGGNGGTGGSGGNLTVSGGVISAASLGAGGAGGAGSLGYKGGHGGSGGAGGKGGSLILREGSVSAASMGDGGTGGAGGAGDYSVGDGGEGGAGGNGGKGGSITVASGTVSATSLGDGGTGGAGGTGNNVGIIGNQETVWGKSSGNEETVWSKYSYTGGKGGQGGQGGSISVSGGSVMAAGGSISRGGDGGVSERRGNSGFYCDALGGGGGSFTLSGGVVSAAGVGNGGNGGNCSDRSGPRRNGGAGFNNNGGNGGSIVISGGSLSAAVLAQGGNGGSTNANYTDGTGGDGGQGGNITVAGGTVSATGMGSGGVGGMGGRASVSGISGSGGKTLISGGNLTIPAIGASIVTITGGSITDGRRSFPEIGVQPTDGEENVYPNERRISLGEGLAINQLVTLTNTDITPANTFNAQTDENGCLYLYTRQNSPGFTLVGAARLPGDHSRAIGIVKQLGIMTGLSDSDFGEAQYLTRGQIATIICRMLDKSLTLPEGFVSQFADLHGQWYEQAALLTEHLGIFRGVANKNGDLIFSGEESVSIVQNLALMLRLSGIDETAGSKSSQSWETAAAAAAASYGADYRIDAGIKRSLNIYRSEAAALAYNALSTPMIASYDNSGGRVYGTYEKTVAGQKYTVTNTLAFVRYMDKGLSGQGTNPVDVTALMDEDSHMQGAAQSMIISTGLMAAKAGHRLEYVLQQEDAEKTSFSLGTAEITEIQEQAGQLAFGVSAATLEALEPGGYTLIIKHYAGERLIAVGEYGLYTVIAASTGSGSGNTSSGGGGGGGDNTTYYTVTFSLNGAVGTAPSNQSVASGGKATQPTAPTRSGYSFEGWYTQSSGGSLWNFTTSTVTASITLYARWTASTSVVAQYSWTVSGNPIPQTKNHISLDSALNTANADAGQGVTNCIVTLLNNCSITTSLTVGGSVTLVVPARYTLSIAAGRSLTIDIGGTLELGSTMTGAGNATFVNNGGTLNGTGFDNFYYPDTTPMTDGAEVESNGAHTYIWNADAGGPGNAGWQMEAEAKIGTKYYETLADAISDTNSGGNVEVVADCTIGSATIDAGVTLTVVSGITLDVTGTLDVEGTLDVVGSIDGALGATIEVKAGGTMSGSGLDSTNFYTNGNSQITDFANEITLPATFDWDANADGGVTPGWLEQP